MLVVVNSMEHTTAVIPGTNQIESLLKKYPVILQLMRFGAIGVINTGLDFLLLNLFSKLLGVDSGTRLGVINVFTFSLAMVQSYFWNRYWAFGASDVTIVRNAVRLAIVGTLGTGAVIAVLLGARQEFAPGYYFVLFTLFIIFEVVVWQAFGLNAAEGGTSFTNQTFGTFVIVSVIGLAINSILVSIISQILAGQTDLFGNLDTIKNVAKIFATAASLIWNFLGYKLIVFRR